MKKHLAILALFLAILTLFSACGSATPAGTEGSTTVAAPGSSEIGTEAPGTDPAGSDAPDATSTPADTGKTPESSGAAGTTAQNPDVTTTAPGTASVVTTAEATTGTPAVTTSPTTTAAVTTTPATTSAGPVVTDPKIFDGKKAIFIGNSMIYYGGVVVKGGYRANDSGWFTQICKANGENVTVTDCTYGSHHLYDFTAAGCKTDGCDVGVGGDLLKGLDLASYDYVFMSESGDNNANIIADVRNVMARFPSEKTVFVYMCHTYTYTKSHTNISSNLANLQKEGVVIVDWGHLCYDVYSGKTAVPGAAQTYNKNTFVNNAGSDTHHPNPLSGYICAQMCYCALTGKTAVGQSFAAKSTVKYGSGSVSFDAYKGKYYTSGTSNFDAVFNSAADMQGLQKLMDQYLNNWKAGVGYDALHAFHRCSHTYGAWQTEREATELLPGLRKAVCTKCGYEKTEEIPKLTGERTNLAKGKTVELPALSSPSGKAADLTDGNVGSNTKGRVDGGYTGKGSSDSYGGNKPADGTKKVSVTTADGTSEYYYTVKVDLGAAKTVDGIRIYAQGYKTTVLDTGVDLLISADGNTWKKVYSGDRAALFSGKNDGKGWENYVESTTAAATDIAPAYLSVDFAAESGIRYVMYGCTGVRDINGYYTARFTEFEVYGN